MASRTATLDDYNAKRNFKATPEPKGSVVKPGGDLYVVQKHDARRLHYDLRLELDGVLKSWAVTKGPSLDPADKRLAVRTEDHPVDYGTFEGVIPEGYGAGTVMLWDRGTWEPKGDPHEGLEKGVLKFELHGERLKGGFALVRMKKRKGEKRENWLLVKERDEDADESRDPRKLWTKSVTTDRGMDAIAEGGTDDGKRGSKAKKSTAKRSASSAKKKSGPASVTFTPPQLAKLADQPPKGEAWLHELKYDGYRIQALIKGDDVRLLTRNGKDWTEKYPAIAEALRRLNVGSAAIDGELVAVDKTGVSRFGLLQKAAGNPSVHLRYYAFDLLSLDGKDLKSEPLLERKAQLESVLKGASKLIHYSDHIEGSGQAVIEKACALDLEGVVSKKGTAPYRSGRGTSWIKSKCIGNDEFVIGGYRKSERRGRPFASLLIGEYEKGKLVYRGRVGTGFDAETLDMVHRKMEPLQRKTSPFEKLPADARRGAVWVTPKLVAQVSYTERTEDGHLRHPSFLGLREDKAAKDVSTALEEDTSDQVNRGKDNNDDPIEVLGVRLTHPGRVMFPEQGATKREIAEYYVAFKDRVLTYLKNRPLSIVRCPSGRGGKCFFQKHYKTSLPDHFRAVSIEQKDGKTSSYLLIDSPEGLVGAAQIGALELHIWGARADDIERPDRLVFDLDPDDSVPFAVVRDAARELRDVLKAAGLQSFALLTGGKGIHVICPLERRRAWPDIKAFTRGFALKLAEAAPGTYVAQASKEKREGKIFIDWMRNQRGATAIAPYSLRARPGAPIATPVSWRELPRIDSAADYTLGNIRSRLAHLKSDPWKGYGTVRQSITNAALEFVRRQQ